MKDFTVQIIAGAIGGALSFLFGEITPAFLSLIALVCLDFITGLMHACIEKSLDSRVCAKGIAKKVYIFCLVAIAHIVDGVANLQVCMNVVTFFYIANEAMSIIENAGRIGLPIPEQLTNILKQLNGKDGAKNELG